MSLTQVLAAPVLSGPLNPLRLFLQADLVVQAVMAGLVIASVWVWAVVIGFSWRMRGLDQRNEAYESEFWKAKDIEAYHAEKGKGDIPSARVAGTAMGELRRSLSVRNPDPEGLRQRLAMAMNGTVEAEADRLAARLNILATVGTSAPFIGLFGTVWGIMRTLGAYAEESFTMARVAPELSEALFATAIGLFAAIPAVIAYNRLSLTVNRFESRLQRFADKLHASLTRELGAG
ncbi:MotA/TolQ/ExbB proton channel family protein [Novosphingobium sp. TH158]|uniref:MotA/TolQ/ExbB proton channel family protein n=1 Tax=Novosphingobium sp. TH158 TaxID=2067455 RepID=UPI000C7C3513|nr:MotA/TolQ/ExbB proton channel family protein [Novosphingobium sp. TH158]PLK27452.1 Tol-Pal system subunit TolQ [Novosphingobium sp. TH158]